MTGGRQPPHGQRSEANGKLRREPGNWLRKQLLGRGVPAVFGFGMLGGVCIGILLQSWWPSWTGGIMLGALTFSAIWLYRLRWSRWRLDYLKKGHLTETEVGHAIEYAVTAPGCAVAHDVMDIAKEGNIDHIVATPLRVWVVETKSSRIPKKEFSRALGQMAANVKAVRNWAPPRTEVQGCLVIDAEGASQRSDPYKSRGEKIWQESRKSFVHKLKKEVLEAQSPNQEAIQLAQRVWALGKLDG